MKISCGTDIIEIERIKKNIENSKTGEAFINKVFTEKEIEYCNSKKVQKYQHFARKICSKRSGF